MSYPVPEIGTDQATIDVQCENKPIATRRHAVVAPVGVRRQLFRDGPPRRRECDFVG